MSQALPTRASITFWPPADALSLEAERIRRTLGDWPGASRDLRICLAPVPAEQGTPNDVWLAFEAPDAVCLIQWQQAGRCVVDISGDATILISAGARYVLHGARRDEWIAALAAFSDCGFDLPDALCLALAWRDDHPVWPARIADFPQVQRQIQTHHQTRTLACIDRFAQCVRAPGLYPVVPNAEWVEKLIDLGVETIQLRVKSSEHAVMRRETVRAVAAARRGSKAGREIQLFINDDWATAIAEGAYGVHLGQEDLASADLGAIANAGLRLGLSTHGYYEILLALAYCPSYVAIGPIFATQTKQVAAAPQGLARLAQYRALLHDLVPSMPTVAIGGISAERLPAVLRTGVDGVAVVGAVTQSNKLHEAVAALKSGFPS